jgi:outer membrane protein assembly factor BamB
MRAGSTHVGLLVLLTACGARTPLEVSAQTRPPASGSVTPATVACASALLPGAPTPMQGYCSTRTQLTRSNAPRSPLVAWTITLPQTTTEAEYFEPYETVVDPVGRAYVAINASPNNPSSTPHALVALDADGSVAWTQDIGGPFGSLVLAADGSIELLLSGPPILERWSRDGTMASALPLVARIGGGAAGTPQPPLAQGADGSVYVESAAGALTRVLPGGSIAWTDNPNQGSSSFGGPIGSVALGSADRIYAWAPGLATVATYDAANGGLVWEAGSNPSVIEGPIVAPDGSALTLAGSLTSSLALQGLDPSGALLPSVALGSQLDPDTCHLAVASDGTRVLLLPQEFAAPGGGKVSIRVVALDPQGTEQWTYSKSFPFPFTPSATSAHYGLFVDPTGLIVVTAGSVFALDLASGSKVWEVDPPNPHVCLEPAVLGANGSILATQCDGTMFLASGG